MTSTHIEVSPTQSSDASVTPVTVIGLGLMGQALAGAFLRAGHPTTVWNRTAAKAEQLVGEGAKLAGSVGDAVAASPLVVVCVSDYTAVRELFEPLGEVDKIDQVLDTSRLAALVAPRQCNSRLSTPLTSSGRATTSTHCREDLAREGNLDRHAALQNPGIGCTVRQPRKQPGEGNSAA